MNKKLLVFGSIGMFAITLVVAGYLVNSFTFNVEVAEPFTLEYAVLGDAGDYNVTEDGICSDNTTVWFTSEDSLPEGAMYPGESRKFCVKINNAGESSIKYNVTSEVINGGVNCSLAFPEVSITGDAISGDTINGFEFTVPGDAPVVTGCEVEISVRRG